MQKWKDMQHVIHVAVLFLFVIVVFSVARIFFVPKSFGELGHYRADAVKETADIPIKHAGQESCKTCHEEIYKEKAAGSHKIIRCESCHEASTRHVQDPVGTKPKRPEEKTMRQFCSVCHGKNISRPAKFPQVDFYTHYPGVSCTSCHKSHNPKL